MGFSMGYKLFIFVSLVTAYLMSTLIKVNYYTRVYDHFPGNCTLFPMNGSEDFALFPNNHVLISSGIEIFNNDQYPPTNVYMVDLNQPSPEPIKLAFEGDFLSKISPDFNPHGLGSWVTENNEYFLYLVNHRRESDIIECFIYHPERKSLQHRKTISHPTMYNVNDVVAVGEDQLYYSQDHYFKKPLVKFFEVFLRIAYGSVWYVDASGDKTQAMIAISSLWYANGVSKSNNGKFIYINECSAGTVTAMTRNKDNTLTKKQSILLEVAPDNTFVSPDDGHLWVGMISKPLEFEIYKKHDDPTSTPCGGRVLHVAVNEEAEFPFDPSKVEEVFSTSGQFISATSSGLCHNNKLLVGSIRTGMMVCDAPSTIY